MPIKVKTRPRSILDPLTTKLDSIYKTRLLKTYIQNQTKSCRSKNKDVHFNELKWAQCGIYCNLSIVCNLKTVCILDVPVYWKLSVVTSPSLPYVLHTCYVYNHQKNSAPNHYTCGITRHPFQTLTGAVIHAILLCSLSCNLQSFR